MLRSIVLLAAVLALADGAAMVRFINTVPGSKTPSGTTNDVVTSNAGRVINSATVERIGLQYFAASVGSTSLQSPTLVWTEATNPRSGEVINGAAPYAWTHSMPPLRQYHAITIGAQAQTTFTAMVDTVANYKATDVSRYNNADPAAQSSVDNYEQTTLKEDGVSLYLSFAAGTYQIQAYTVLVAAQGASNANYAQLPRQLSPSLRSVTFVDGHVYTIIATGFGAYTASTPTTGNTVALTLIEESVAPTTFGMASLRWFHAIRSQSANSITVYLGDANAASAVASNIAFGTVSNYVDVVPATKQVFPVTVSSSTQTVVAPSSSSRLEVTHDVRAGLRATIICAQNDETTATVFCRMIPSRVVAYVRLVNDFQAQTTLVQGAFGAQALKDVKLTLWASYEQPRPSQVKDISQVIGTNNIPATPVASRGLYGVVSAVASGSCSGYGEVFVPMLIMDFAVRFTVIRDNTEVFAFDGGAANPTNGYNTAARSNIQDPITGSALNGNVANTDWFIGAPIFKRVNFVLKTEGFATLSGSLAAIRDDTNTADRWFAGALLLDMYMEPGQYYSLIAFTNTVPTLPYTPAAFQAPSQVNFAWRLDRTVDLVASGVPSGKGLVNWIPFGNQNFAGNVNFRQVGTSNINIQPAINVNTGATAYTVIQSPGSVDTFTWNAPAVALTATAGSYTFDQSLSATVTAVACQTAIPGSTAITISSGDIWDVYVLNSFGCAISNNDNNQLNVYLCQTQSALNTNNAVNTLLSGTAAPTPSSPGFFAASASTASSSVALFVAAIIALAALLL